MWRIRADDGTIFGPTSLASLQAWAREGRLAPGHMISRDGCEWKPVASMPVLEMRWVVEVSPGTFYGPLHAEALEELVREGALAPDLPRFTLAETFQDSSAVQQALTERLREQKKEFAAHNTELERQLREARTEAGQLRGQVETRDLEFDAERQEFQAAAARHKAELAKLESLCASLRKQLERVDSREQELTERVARAEELEQRLAETEARLAGQREQYDTQIGQERQARHDAEKALLEARAIQRRRNEQFTSMQEKCRALELRLTSLRKLLRQAIDTLGEPGGSASSVTDVVIDEGDASAAHQVPPPRREMSLQALEAQAQHEIRRLGQNGRHPFRRR